MATKSIFSRTDFSHNASNELWKPSCLIISNYIRVHMPKDNIIVTVKLEFLSAFLTLAQGAIWCMKWHSTCKARRKEAYSKWNNFPISSPFVTGTEKVRYAAGQEGTSCLYSWVTKPFLLSVARVRVSLPIHTQGHLSDAALYLSGIIFYFKHFICQALLLSLSSVMTLKSSNCSYLHFIVEVWQFREAKLIQGQTASKWQN